VEAGNVRSDAAPERAAALLVAALVGIWGTGRSAPDAELMRTARGVVSDCLERPRP
jgi:hypothetical protein